MYVRYISLHVHVQWFMLCKIHVFFILVLYVENVINIKNKI